MIGPFNFDYVDNLGLGPASPEPVATNFGWLFVVECKYWPCGQMAVRDNQTLIVGRGTDVQRVLFEASLSPWDRRFLATLKIAVDWTQ